ncbi:MAG TPA: nucleotidyltransferase-like protein [Bacillota bacterium]|nr:nucleotidyltransferase-like protein [Bacillota bacterium]
MSLHHVTSSICKDESLVRICSSSNSPFINGVDELYLVITQEAMSGHAVNYYKVNGKTIEKRKVREQELMKSILVDGNRQMTQWILLGEALADPMGRIESLRREMKNQSSLAYKKKIFLDFAAFVRKYMEAKEFLGSGHLLDSFNSILQSLNHWARLAILGVGEHPETTVWEQIKVIDPSVYKLYEELVTSIEPLDKRVELLLLALDFAVMSMMERCVAFVLDILRSKDTPWTVAEILDHPSIADPNFDLFLLLEKMVKRSLIREHSLLKDGVQEKCYSIF